MNIARSIYQEVLVIGFQSIARSTKHQGWSGSPEAGFKIKNCVSSEVNAKCRVVLHDKAGTCAKSFELYRKEKHSSAFST
jgi:hypothetical protein